MLELPRVQTREKRYWKLKNYQEDFPKEFRNGKVMHQGYKMGQTNKPWENGVTERESQKAV